MAEKRKVYFDNRPTLPHIAPHQMSKIKRPLEIELDLARAAGLPTVQVRIQGYICDKLLSFYKNNPFAPSLTQLVNRELAAAINAKPQSNSKPKSK